MQTLLLPASLASLTGFGVIQNLGGLLQNGLVQIVNQRPGIGKKKVLSSAFLRLKVLHSRERKKDMGMGIGMPLVLLLLQEERYVLYNRIMLACLDVLHHVASGNQHMDDDLLSIMEFLQIIFDSASPAALRRMICHGNGNGNGNGEEAEQTSLHSMEAHLLQCLQTFMWSNAATNQSNTRSATGTGTGNSHNAFILELMRMALHMSRIRNGKDVLFQAYFAAIVLGVDMERSRSYYTQLKDDLKLEGNDESRTDLDWYIHLWKTLYLVMDDKEKTKEDLDANANANADAIINAKGISDIMAGREVVYLQNVLDILALSKSKATSKPNVFVLELLLVKFMGHLFDPFRIGQNGIGSDDGRVAMELQALMVLSGLAAKGTDPMSLYNGNAKVDPAEPIDLTEDSDDDDDDDDGNGDVAMEESISFRSVTTTSNPVTTSRTNQQSASKKLRRQDLQTMHKLDHLYKVKLSQAQKETVEWLQKQSLVKASNLCKVAKDLGGGEIISHLIPTVFDSKHGIEVQKTFCVILSMAMQNCTGVTPRDCAMSPLLSKLAFHPTFLETLWNCAKNQLSSVEGMIKAGGCSGGMIADALVKTYSSIVCFCDLFSHHLMALDDEEFLLSFTNLNPNGKSRSQILAADVVAMMRSLLYELYWSKPVVSMDYDFPSCQDSIVKFHRARLLLSGTKVWNSLHIRWSRLLRTAKFCDEESWWFPHLITRHQDESGAMDPSVAAMNVAMDEAENDSVDSAMELDDNIQSNAAGENEDLASSFKDPKMARILVSIPHALPFDRRAKLFSSLLAADIIKTQDESAAMRDMMLNMQRGIEGAEYSGRERVRIRRDELYNDSLDQLSVLGRRLKKKVQVTFVSKHGNEEAGVDGGGLFKEFLDDLIKDAFDPEAMRDGTLGPLFIESPLRTLAINTSIRPTSASLAHYQFLGRVLGKAVYESILVDPQFCLPFLNQLLGQHNTIDDLKNLDPTYYKHLRSLRTMSEEEIKDLDLTFELTVATENGSSQTVELIPGGSSIPVSKGNAIRYVHLVAHRRLNKETAIQTNAFLYGFRDLIPASWVRLFSPYELQKVISGDDAIQGFDVKGLKSVMLYGGGYHPSQPAIQWLWQVIEEMTAEQKNKFLKFVTSCSRQPLLGFGALVPLPCIQQVRLRDDEQSMDERHLRLPTSATCMHLLKLPNYRSKEILRSKLLYAVEAGAGFELS